MKTKVFSCFALAAQLTAASSAFADSRQPAQYYWNLALVGLKYTPQNGYDFVCSAPGLAPKFGIVTSEGITTYYIEHGKDWIAGGFKPWGDDAVLVDSTIVLSQGKKVSAVTYVFGEPPRPADIPEVLRVLVAQHNYSAACRELNLPTGRGEVAKDLGEVTYQGSVTTRVPLPPAVRALFPTTVKLQNSSQLAR